MLLYRGGIGVVIRMMVVGFCVVGGSLFDPGKRQMIVDKHNEMRKSDPASNMKRLVWNGVLARMASEWAEKCGSDHGQPEALDRPYEYIGQNMNIFSKRQTDYISSIDAWMDEKAFYDFESMTCQKGKKCGHYRQLVWAETSEIGCGYAKCSLVTGLQLDYGDVFVCNYGPSGNIKGQKPYKIGAKCSACAEAFKCEREMCVSTSATTKGMIPVDTTEEQPIELDLSNLPPEFDIMK